MELQQFRNNAMAELISGISDVATTLTIGNGEIANFPTSLTGGRYFELTLSDNTLALNVRETAWEVVRVVGVAVDGANLELTVVRPVGAVSWGAGTLCSMRATAEALARAFEAPDFDRILTADGQVLVSSSGNVLTS